MRASHVPASQKVEIEVDEDDETHKKESHDRGRDTVARRTGLGKPLQKEEFQKKAE